MKALPGILLLVLPLLCGAEVVVPIDAVEEHVNIRLSPDPKSEIVGHLDQGDAAVLVATIEGWHEIEIVGGSTGFISVEWTNVLPEAPVLAEAAAAELPRETAVAEHAELENGTTVSAPVSESASSPASGADDSDAAADEALANETAEAVAEPIAEDPVADNLDEELAVTTPIANTAEQVTEVDSEQGEVEEAIDPEVALDDVVVETVVDAVAVEAPSAVMIEEAVAPSPAPAGSQLAPVAVIAAGSQGEQGPAGPAGPPGAATIKGTENFLVRFSKPETGANSQLYDDGNRVGIGTTEPKQRLEVNGNIQIHEKNSSVAGLMITQSSGETGYIMHNRASTLTIGAGSVDRLTIDRDGNVGIGVARPKHPIEMVSGAHVTAGGVWTNSSSRARKENISNLESEDALEALAQLQPVQFNYRNEAQETYVGFIAEDVPALVATNGRDSLSTMDIVAVLTKVVQAQQQKIEELEARLNLVK
jgi:hypothetical protein